PPFVFFFKAARPHRHLHSFPTRRSSDLAGNMMARRGTEDPSGLGIYPNWGFSWPANRRVMYNRASCDLQGKPWDLSRKQVWWNRSEEHTSELQSLAYLVCRLLLEKKNKT